MPQIVLAIALFILGVATFELAVRLVRREGSVSFNLELRNYFIGFLGMACLLVSPFLWKPLFFLMYLYFVFVIVRIAYVVNNRSKEKS